ncbi:unnamed protein product [Colias eurytheme]|nr:unnamed protein product [Colias eurytheme]
MAVKNQSVCWNTVKGIARIANIWRGCDNNFGGWEGATGGAARRLAAVNWDFENFCRIVFTLNFVMWVKVKLEFRAVCAVSLNYKVDSQVSRIDFHLMFIKCFKVLHFGHVLVSRLTELGYIWVIFTIL